MNKKKLFFHVLTALILLVTCTSLAHAQATRTWVSGVGDDANPCSRTAPCKTFAGAISKTASGGEINVLDPGGFGGVTITKPITISSEGFEAGVLVSGTNAIIVNVPNATDAVVLRGLDIEGLGTGLSGITVLTGGTVFVEKCTINRFTTAAINFVPTVAGSQLHVVDTIVRKNGVNPNGGINVAPTGSGTAKVSLDRVRMESNVFGLKVQGSSNTTVKDSVAAGNDFAGFSTAGSSALTFLTIEHSSSVGNGTGVGCALNTTVRIGNMSIIGNGAAVATAGSNCFSFKNNDSDAVIVPPLIGVNPQ